MNKPPFDPSKPFEVVDSKPAFDPSKPFEVVEDKPGIGSMVSQAYEKATSQGPYAPFFMADRNIRNTFDVVGEKGAEELARRGTNPYLAAGIGTTVQMTPDIIESVATPIDTPMPRKLLRPISAPMAERSIGLTKRFQGTPFARGKSRQAAEVALDNKLIPFSGDPTVTLENALELQTKSGRAIGQIRDSAGNSDLKPVFDRLAESRYRSTKGRVGGIWDSIHAKYDQAQETIEALLMKKGEVPLSEVEEAKKVLSDSINWVADNVSQKAAKDISNSIESGVESILRSKGIDMTAYKAQKRLFGATKTMEKPLNLEIGGQSGNNAVSLPSMVGVAGSLATGNVKGALAALGVMEALRRRGAGVGARILDSVGSTSGRINLYRAAPPVHRLLNPINPVSEPREEIKGLLNKKPKQEPNRSQSKFSEKNNNGNKQGNKNNNASDIKSSGNQNKPPKVLNETEALKYLRKARGNKKQARRLAIADGWILQ